MSKSKIVYIDEDKEKDLAFLITNLHNSITKSDVVIDQLLEDISNNTTLDPEFSFLNVAEEFQRNTYFKL